MERTSQAVKVVWEWRLRPGAGPRFSQWVEQLVADARGAPGFEGSSVFSAQDDWLLLLRFAGHDDLVRWQEAASTRALFAAAAPLATGAPRPQQRTGLETWFTLPGQAGMAPPPRWKMALVTWCALLPQVIVLGLVMPAGIGFPWNVAVSTAIPVVMLTWVVMPRLTMWLQGWLHAGTRSG